MSSLALFHDGIFEPLKHQNLPSAINSLAHLIHSTRISDSPSQSLSLTRSALTLKPDPAPIGVNLEFSDSGYFVVDKDSTPDKLVFNRIVTLRDSYGKGGK